MSKLDFRKIEEAMVAFLQGEGAPVYAEKGEWFLECNEEEFNLSDLARRIADEMAP